MSSREHGIPLSFSLRLFSLCLGNDNDIVKGDFADKATLKYGTPIIFAYPSRARWDLAECSCIEVQYRVRISHTGPDM